MSLVDILKDLGSHQYVVLAVLLAAYARRLCASDSKFPISLPAAWQPVATAAVGACYGGLVAYQGGLSVDAAALSTVMAAGASGLADMVLVAIFADPTKAPAWARAIAFVVDDLTGGGPGTTTKVATVTLKSSGDIVTNSVETKVTPEAVKPLVSPRTRRTWRFLPALGLAGLGVLGLGAIPCATGCAQLASLIPADVKSLEEKILADVNAGMTLDQIVADVGKSVTGDALQIVYDYVASLLDSALLSDTQRASLGAMKVEAVQKIAMRSGSRVIDSVTK